MTYQPRLVSTQAPLPTVNLSRLPLQTSTILINQSTKSDPRSQIKLSDKSMTIPSQTVNQWQENFHLFSILQF